MMDRKEIGIGAGLVFLPPLISLILLGKSRGMVEALQIGVNISFALLAIGAVGILVFLSYKAFKAWKG